jgi:hypothetical protein
MTPANTINVMFAETPEFTYGDVIETLKTLGYDFSAFPVKQVDTYSQIVAAFPTRQAGSEFIEAVLDHTFYAVDEESYDDTNVLRAITLSSDNPMLYADIAYFNAYFMSQLTIDNDLNIEELQSIVLSQQERISTLESIIEINCIQNVKDLTNTLITALKEAGYKINTDLLASQFPKIH